MTVAGRFDGSLMTIALSRHCHPQRLQLRADSRWSTPDGRKPE
ncbi:hypothetical protein O23A_p3342 [Aeromonas salmonicida]|nr:hypothetical protein O23A_p3342 [Aeromonas salmonicida]